MATKHLTHCQRVNNSLMYSTIFIFNGGACAMIGPSMAAIRRSTGLPQARPFFSYL